VVLFGVVYHMIVVGVTEAIGGWCGMDWSVIW